MKVLICSICLSIISNIVFSQEKTFEREYSYKASDLDSKISCRAIAINQLRSILLNEIGVYVESESILKTSDVSGKFAQDFVENIATISAGVTKLEILEEKWNGETFWIKASITIDPKSLEESLKNIVADKQRLKELEDLKQKLDDASNEINRLKSGLAKNQNGDQTLQQQKYKTEVDALLGATCYFNGIAKFDLQDYEGAVSEFTMGIRFLPDDTDFYYNRGNAKRHLQDYLGASADYTKAIELKPDHAQAYVNRGNVYRFYKDNRGAFADYTKAIEFKPDLPDAYNNRGIVRSDLQDYENAIVDYTKAIDLKPDYSQAYYNRGNAKFDLQDFRGAIVDYTKAIELNPDYEKAYHNRSVAQEKLRP